MFDKIIDTHTTDQAVEDGILVDIRKLNPNFEKGLFSHVTATLIGKGYIDEETKTIKIPNLLDLLNQSLEIVRRTLLHDAPIDTFYSGTVELPSGEKQKVFICQNETGKYTIILPEDY